MKKILLICLTTMIVGCEKQPEIQNENASEKFDAADQKISDYLDLLDNPNADKDAQKKVLCEDYPKVYEKEYMPALMKLSTQDTKEKLLSDLKITTDYYSQKLGITCD
ncbi:hypothetical protein [Acinetobacter junii]|uniref:hypothetical protein n=1 Tax=Acinetobacter junii TaxID=40215 RepID=UPI002091C2CF|nr:hypothetical protein [Acinetobacter junii]USR74445.1 hypothetical protein NGM19_05765 [Acinetobacter junii]